MTPATRRVGWRGPNSVDSAAVGSIFSSNNWTGNGHPKQQFANLAEPWRRYCPLLYRNGCKVCVLVQKRDEPTILHYFTVDPTAWPHSWSHCLHAPTMRPTVGSTSYHSVYTIQQLTEPVVPTAIQSSCSINVSAWLMLDSIRDWSTEWRHRPTVGPTDCSCVNTAKFSERWRKRLDGKLSELNTFNLANC